MAFPVLNPKWPSAVFRWLPVGLSGREARVAVSGWWVAASGETVAAVWRNCPVGGAKRLLCRAYVGADVGRMGSVGVLKNTKLLHFILARACFCYRMVLSLLRDPLLVSLYFVYGPL